MNEETVIIGWGVVGKNTAKVLNIKNHIDRGQNDPRLSYYKYFIFCLPTPTINGKQDLTAIEEWLDLIRDIKTDPIVIIRSTILPGTTEKLSKKYGLKIVHVPEFLTEATALEDTKHPEFLVIGGDNYKVREEVGKLFSPIRPKYSIYFCTSVTAEVLKYTMNSWFSLKVVFANQIFNVCEKSGAAYGAITRALEEHKWGSKNGWEIWHKNARGFSGKCLPKDIEAFSNAFELPLLTAVQWINNKLVKIKK